MKPAKIGVMVTAKRFLNQHNYRELAQRLIDQATNPNVKLALTFIAKFSEDKIERIRHDSRFQTILKTVTVKK